MNHVFSFLVLGTIGLLALAACGGSAQGIAPASEGELAADAAASYISSSTAGEHIGEEGTVRGNVQEYLYKQSEKGKPYLLIFDKPVPKKGFGNSGRLAEPGTFKVVIWKDKRKNFPENFAAAYSGHTVCATRMIVDYNGDPAIEARDPSQLKIDC